MARAATCAGAIFGPVSMKPAYTLFVKFDSGSVRDRKGRVLRGCTSSVEGAYEPTHHGKHVENPVRLPRMRLEIGLTPAKAQALRYRSYQTLDTEITNRCD